MIEDVYFGDINIEFNIGYKLIDCTITYYDCSIEKIFQKIIQNGCHTQGESWPNQNERISGGAAKSDLRISTN